MRFKIQLLIFYILLFSISELHAQQPPGTEVILFELQKETNYYSIQNPVNISSNPGYDNQPYFMPEGDKLLYSSARKDNNTDIILYDISSGIKHYLTNTPGSEYSPTVTTDGENFTSILLEKDGTQLLWKYSLDDGTANVLIEDLKIGYHCWLNEFTVVSFVLGDTVTLQVSDLKSGSNKIVAKNIRRSLHKIPNQDKISFIHAGNEGIWHIKWLDPLSEESGIIAKALENSQDMAWTPNGEILMGQESKLFVLDPENPDQWIEISDLEDFGFHGITRIAVSPNGNYIALVVNEDQ